MTVASRDVLLEAIASFLAEDVMPQVKDRALGFRLRIAAHLLGTIAEETRQSRKLDMDELKSLRALIPEESWTRLQGGLLDEVSEELEALNQGLAKMLKQGGLKGERRDQAREHLLKTLRARLAVTSPGFDLSPEIE